MSEESPDRIEQLLEVVIYHQFAPVAAILFTMVAIVLSAVSIFVDGIPPNLGSVLLAVSIVWIMAGGVHGWLPGGVHK